MQEVDGYSRAQIALHWIVLALIGVSYVSEDAMKAAWRASNRGQEIVGLTHNIHVVTGILILLLVLTRLFLRRSRGAPPAPEAEPPLMKLAGRLTHWGLYAVLIVMPATGLAAWFGSVRRLGEVHEVLFNVLLALVALHVLAVLFHHFVLKDGLLDRMRRPV